MKTVWRAVGTLAMPGGQQVRYESHDCASQAEAAARAKALGLPEVHRIDVDERTGTERNRTRLDAGG